MQSQHQAVTANDKGRADRLPEGNNAGTEQRETSAVTLRSWIRVLVDNLMTTSSCKAEKGSVTATVVVTGTVLNL